MGEEDQNAPLDTVIKAYKALPNADIVVPSAVHSVLPKILNIKYPIVQAPMA